MSAQSPTVKKSTPLLANLKQSYSSGNSFGFGRKTPTSSPVDPVSVAAPIITPTPDSINLDSVALDTADAVIENIIARRQVTSTPAESIVDPTQVNTPVVPAQPIAPVQPIAPAQPVASVQTIVPVQPELASAGVSQLPVTTPQAFPLAVDQMYQEQQNQQAAQQVYAQSGSASKKESAIPSSPDTAQIDAGGGTQYVEQEKNLELPVEVEGFLQHVDDNATQAPQEIIMAELAKPVALPTVIPKQAVVVLPITPDVEQTAKGKNAKHSVKWLVEWSHKMMKLFEGKVVYRPTQDEVK